MSDEATFFPNPAAFRRWLAAHHDTTAELWVGYHRKATGKPSMTWPESVAEALCYGWIDGIRRKLDDTRYRIRFTPRRPRSIWSAVNVQMARELIAAGRMQPAGLAAFQAADPERTAIYSYERARARFSSGQQARFRSDAAAWRWFQAQPPGYRKQVTAWVTSAKREETRDRRLSQLIACCRAGKRIPALTRPDSASRHK